MSVTAEVDPAMPAWASAEASTGANRLAGGSYWTPGRD